MAATSRRGRAIRIIALSTTLPLAVYAAAGFWLLPWLVEKFALPELSARTGGRCSAGSIAFNPFALALSLDGLSLKDPQGRALASADRAMAELRLLASVWERRVHARVLVQGLALDLLIGSEGGTNLDFLLGGSPSPSESSAPFYLEEFSMTGARISLRAGSPQAPFAVDWPSVNLSLRGVCTGAGTPGGYLLQARDETGGQINLEGDLQLNPLASQGRLRASGLRLAPWAKPLLAGLDLEARQGQAGLQAAYRMSWVEGKPRLELQGAELELSDWLLAETAGTSRLSARRLKASSKGLNWPDPISGVDSVLVEDLAMSSGAENEPAEDFRSSRLAVEDLAVDLVGRGVEIQAIELGAGRLGLHRQADGRWSWPGAAWLGRRSAAGSDAGGGPWKTKIGGVRVSGFELGVQDATVQPAVHWDATAIDVELKDLSSETGSSLWLNLKGRVGERGRFDIAGKLVPLPVLVADFSVALEGFELGPLQPYLPGLSRISLDRGQLNLAGNLDYYQGPTDSIRFSGRADIVDLRTRDSREGRDFVNWKSLAFNGLIAESIPRRVSIREIAVNEPYARVLVAADGSINIAENLGLSLTAKAQPSGEDMAVVVGALRIADGRVDFTDDSLKPLSFATQVYGLKGNIRGLSSQRSAKADLLLEGRINDRAPVKISGQINPFSLGTYTDVLMQFHDVDLTTLSPYSGKFAGYRIEKGKLSMNLRYKLEDDRLEGENELSFDHLVLGERVESADATSLPVQMAVALLKDGDGHIDVSLPISGDLRDPQVSIRGLLAGAATQFLSKLVGSPFAMIGGLFADGPEQLDTIAFDPGQDRLSADERSKLAKVSLALRERPGLLLDIQATADAKADRPALAERSLLRRLKGMGAAERGLEDGQEGDKLSEAEYGRLFSLYCRQGSPGVPADLVLGQGNADLSGAPLAEAKRRVLDNWKVGELELRGLAMARGERIRRYMVGEGGLPDQRIYVLDAKFTSSDARKIKAMLSLNAR